MKAVIVLDITDGLNIDLSKCKAVTKLYQHDEENRLWDFIEADVCYELKEMPEKYEVWDKHDYELGWNDAIEEILGETE